MTDHANLVRAREIYAAFEAGDPGVWQLLSPDCTWHEGGNNQVSGSYTGPEEVMSLLGKMAQLTDGTFTSEVHDMLASDDHVVALVRLKGERDGEELATDGVHVMRVVDDVFTEVSVIYADQAVADAFWS